MSTRQQSIALDAPGSIPNAPLSVRGYRPVAIIVLAVALTAIGLGMAVVSETADVRLVWIALALLIAAGLFGLLGWFGSISPSFIRLDADAEVVRFVPPWHVRYLYFSVGLLGLVPMVFSIAFTSFGAAPAGITAGRFGPYAVGLAALAMLVEHFRWLRTPPGLTLTPERLVGVRGAAHVDVAWDDLAGVSIVDHRGAKLVLDFASGAAAEIEPRWTGSDPNVLAAIVEHYRSNPADRPLLTDPAAAIRRVEAAAAPTPPR